MKVVIASARYRPSLGGVETHAREVAMRLSRQFDVAVVTSNPGNFLPTNEILDGVQVHRVLTWPSGGDPFIPWGWSRVCRKLAPDVLLIDGYQSAISAHALRFAARHKIPSIVVFHEGANPNPLRHALYPLQRRVLGRWFRRARYTVATAPHEIDLYQRQLKLKTLKYIPNGADLPPVQNPPQKQPFKIVSIGRLERQKRHHLVVEALAELRRDGNPWSLTILGVGSERENLLTQARDLGVAEAVTVAAFEGAERDGMSSELLSARIVIAPSTFETHPMAVVEAALLGCRVVVPREGNSGVVSLAERGVVEAIASETGSDIAHGLREALLRDFQTNREELSTWDECADQFRRLIEEIASERERR
ncbi:MAG: glycosyltransferase family 4 protein [Acidobacteria bacterium]|nr:glycosyltransferase family 4 protein [Acidobacteriota bacterium]